MDLHTGAKECCHCHKVFTSERHLSRHICEIENRSKTSRMCNVKDYFEDKIAVKTHEVADEVNLGDEMINFEVEIANKVPAVEEICKDESEIEKMFCCQMCNKVFKNQRSLKDHETDLHTGAKEF